MIAIAFVPCEIADSTHTGEILYLFKKTLFLFAKVTQEDERVINEFTTAYTNFAKYSNPNGPDPSKSELSAQWIPIDKEHCRSFVFTSNQNYMKEDFFEGRTSKFIEITAKYRT